MEQGISSSRNPRQQQSYTRLPARPSDISINQVLERHIRKIGPTLKTPQRITDSGISRSVPAACIPAQHGAAFCTSQKKKKHGTDIGTVRTMNSTYAARKLPSWKSGTGDCICRQQAFSCLMTQRAEHGSLRHLQLPISDVRPGQPGPIWDSVIRVAPAPGFKVEWNLANAGSQSNSMVR